MTQASRNDAAGKTPGTRRTRLSEELAAISETERLYLLGALQGMLFLILFLLVLSRLSLLLATPVLFVEVFILTYLIKRELKNVFFAWEFQVFLALLALLAFDVERTLNVAGELSPIAHAFVVAALVAVQVLITIYAVVGERAVRGIMLMLSSSTTFIVFLIILFVGSEALPAFEENGVADMITGDVWQPFYEAGASDTITLITPAIAYNFTMVPDEEVPRSAPGVNYTMRVHLENTGAEPDTIILDIAAPPLLSAALNRTTLSLAPAETATVLVTLRGAQQGTYDLALTATSLESGKARTATLHPVIAATAFDLSPDTLHIDAEGSGVIRVPLTITNTGSGRDTFHVTVEALDIFKPSIAGENFSWNYTTASGVITLDSGESSTMMLTPRLTSYIEGTHQLDITATSETLPSLRDETTVFFTFIEERFFTIDALSKPVNPGGAVIYHIVSDLHDGEPLTISIGGSVDPWFVELSDQNGVVMLTGSGTAVYTGTGNETAAFALTVSAPQEVNGALHLTVALNRGGTDGTYGILQFIVGTILTSAIAIAIAAPLGVGCAVFLAEFAPARIRRILRPLYELLAGIPSIIYGLWGYATFGPFLGAHVFPIIAETLGTVIPWLAPTASMSHSIMTASIVLSLMILPIVITLSEDAVRSVPRELREGSLAVGATRWQGIRRIILPAASSGIIASIILALGRAIGETMAVLLIMGPVTNGLPVSLFDSVGTMTATIAHTFGWSYSRLPTRHAIFAMGFILFLMIFLLNTIIFLIEGGDRDAGRQSVFRRIAGRSMARFRTLAALPFNRAPETGSAVDSAHPFKGIAWRPSAKALRAERGVHALLVLGASLVTLLLFLIIGNIFINGGASLQASFFLDEELPPAGGGFFNAIVGSVLLTGLAIAVAAPLSIGSAIYVQEYADPKSRLTRIILFASDTLASTPSIVFGAFGFMLFVYYLEFNLSLLAGGLTLAAMIIPLMLRSSIEAIKSVPFEYREASLALGATKWETVQRAVLPFAAPGISSGTILSIGRAIGETAAILLTAGYMSHTLTSLFDPAASLPVAIYQMYQVFNIWPELWEKMYAAALVLIVVVLILNGMARLISRRASRMMERE